MKKRPIPVTIVGLVLIAVGAIGFVYHLKAIDFHQRFPAENVWILGLSLAAIICGSYMLRGHNWARWAAMAWIAVHVAISFLNSWQQVLMHAVIMLLFAYALFSLDARAYFRRPGANQLT